MRLLAVAIGTSTYKGEAFEAFSSVDDLEAVSDALVHSGVGLKKG